MCGVLAAGFKLITTQEGRDLIPLGKAFMWAMLTSVCLAGFVNLFQGTVDTWTAGVLKAASSMMKTAWSHNTLAASEFFNLDLPIALALTIVMWLCNLISKVFCYLRAGLLPIMVGVAPMWAAMSWTETGRQAFGKVMGWLFAFLLYKPVAALVMAAGCSIMVTAGSGDDSQAITLMLTISVIVLLPAMIRLIVPAVAGSVGGGGVIPSMLGGMAGMGVMAAGGALKAGAKAMTGLASGGGRPSAPDGARRTAGASGGDPPGGLSGTGPGTGSGPRTGPTSGGASPPDDPDHASGAGVAPDGAKAAGPGPSASPSGAANPSAGSGGPPDGARAVQGPSDAPSGAGPVRTDGEGPDGANRTAARKTKEF